MGSVEVAEVGPKHMVVTEAAVEEAVGEAVGSEA